MADQNIEYRTTETRRSGSGALTFVVGGLVVLVGVLAYIIFGAGFDVSSSDPASPSSIEINTNADSAAGAEAAEETTDGAAAAGADADAGGSDAAAGAAASSND